MGGTLEFIQSFNNPKIIDASDSSLMKGKLHCGWTLLTVIRNFIELPKLLIKKEHKLFSGSFKLSSATVFVTYWVSLLSSEAPLDDILICSLSSLQTD